VLSYALEKLETLLLTYFTSFRYLRLSSSFWVGWRLVSYCVVWNGPILQKDFLYYSTEWNDCM